MAAIKQHILVRSNPVAWVIPLSFTGTNATSLDLTVANCLLFNTVSSIAITHVQPEGATAEDDNIEFTLGDNVLVQHAREKTTVDLDGNVVSGSGSGTGVVKGKLSLNYRGKAQNSTSFAVFNEALKKTLIKDCLIIAPNGGTMGSTPGTPSGWLYLIGKADGDQSFNVSADDADEQTLSFTGSSVSLVTDATPDTDFLTTTLIADLTTATLHQIESAAGATYTPVAPAVGQIVAMRTGELVSVEVP